MHAQSDHVAHAAAIREGLPFETYGNLHGRPRSGPAQYLRYGRMRGAALVAYTTHLLAGAVKYELCSYSTPIAWLTADGVWHIDQTRYGNASDAALRYASLAIDWVARDGVLIYNHRHGLSSAQLALMGEAGHDSIDVSGPQHATARALARRGYLRELNSGRYMAQPFAQSLIKGAPVPQSVIRAFFK